MAKPMVITLPVLLLLVDFWPLQRFPRRPLSKLVLEKIPLLSLFGSQCRHNALRATRWRGGRLDRTSAALHAGKECRLLLFHLCR